MVETIVELVMKFQKTLHPTPYTGGLLLTDPRRFKHLYILDKDSKNRGGYVGRRFEVFIIFEDSEIMIVPVGACEVKEAGVDVAASVPNSI